MAIFDKSFVKKKEIIPEIKMVIIINIKIFLERIGISSFIATAAPVRVLEIA
jgi:hypothetical protein